MEGREWAAVVFGLICGMLAGYVIALAVEEHERIKTTPAQAWMQYVEVKDRHERAYLEGLK